MLNKAARQLFRGNSPHRLSDLASLGPELSAAAELPPGSRKITRIIVDGIPQKALLAFLLEDGSA